ncbi:MAG: hypothetical protein EOO88_13710 [Pedobacter sp.]|nr:MAG: hypothetical protein EOO88_13710 [Pedobacter sp.]
MLKQLFFQTIKRLGAPVEIAPWATLRNQFFSMRVPSHWKVETMDGSTVIEPGNGSDAITITVRGNVHIPMTVTKQSILAMFAGPWDEEKVLMKRFPTHVEFNYSTVENGHVWHTRSFRKLDRMYLISINCDQSRWEADKETFLFCLESFKMRS